MTAQHKDVVNKLFKILLRNYGIFKINFVQWNISNSDFKLDLGAVQGHTRQKDEREIYLVSTF
jgi:hypothetical protein